VVRLRELHLHRLTISGGHFHTRSSDQQYPVRQVKVICMLLKAPHPGTVKTRLARDVGDERAVAIYRALVEHQAKAIPLGWQVSVYFTPTDAAETMRAWLQPYLPGVARFEPQSEGDLGQRLRAAVEVEFRRGARRVFLIGGDCPGISSNYLAEADQALKECDLVIGPAADGGYVLLGLKTQSKALFENVAWSTRLVLDQTLSAACSESLRVKLLATLEDVDDAESFARQSKLFSGSF
jgi:rSAM/selenodomain-associated transferase 1